MMLLGVDDWRYPILIVECLFVGAHSDVSVGGDVKPCSINQSINDVRIHEELEDNPDDSGTSGLFDAPYGHKHTTTALLSTNCSESHRHASYSELFPPSGGQWPARLALALITFNSSIVRAQRQFKVIKWKKQSYWLIILLARGSISKSGLLKMRLWWWYRSDPLELPRVFTVVDHVDEVVVICLWHNVDIVCQCWHCRHHRMMSWRIPYQ